MKKKLSIKTIAALSAGIMAVGATVPTVSLLQNEIRADDGETDSIVTVTVTSNNEDLGTVAVSNDGDVGTTGVELTATETASGIFLGWFVKQDDGELSDTPISTNPKYTYKPNESCEVVGVFAEAVTITVTSDDTSMGTVTGGGKSAVNSKITLTASPKSGYKFSKWVVGSTEVGTDATLEYTVPHAATTIKAIFEADDSTPNPADTKVTVNASSADSTMGTVSGGGEVTVGSNVTLRATPNSGYKFVKWVDADNNQVSTNATYTFSASATTTTFKAVFEAEAATTYTVTALVNDSSMGSVTGAGSVTAGSSVELKATPKSGYKFVKWTDDKNAEVSTSATLSITPTKDVTYTAVFAADTAGSYTVSLAVNDATMGAVSGAGTVTAGNKVTIAAIANSGYKFVKWTDTNGTQVSTNATMELTPAADISYIAVFERDNVVSYNVTASVKDNKGGTVTGGGKVESGKSVSLTATPASGYKFVAWLDESGKVFSTSQNITVTPSADIALKAEFASTSTKTYTMNVKTNKTSYGTVEISNKKPTKGSMVTLTATPKSGYKFSHWEDANGNNVSSDAVYTFEATSDSAGTYMAYFIDEDAETVTITFVDPDEDGVEGITITVYSSKVKVGSFKTNEDGEVMVDVPAGKYTFKITGYDEDLNELFYPTTEFAFTLKDSGKVTGDDEIELKEAITVLNRKDGITGEPIYNATLTIFDSANKKLVSGTTDTQGNLTIKGLQAGTYTYQESTPANGYSADTKTYKFTVNGDGTVTGDASSATCSFKATLVAKNKDDDKGVANVTLYLYDNANTLIGMYNTNADGIAEVAGIPAGKYIVKQGTLPDGLKPVDESIIFSVEADGKINGTTTIYSSKTGEANTPAPTNNSNDAPPANNTNNANKPNGDNNSAPPAVEKPGDSASKPDVEKPDSANGNGTSTVIVPGEMITTGVESAPKKNIGAYVSIACATLAAAGAGIVTFLKKKNKK